MVDSFLILELSDLSSKMCLDSCKPNKNLVEESMSFDVSRLDTIDVATLRKYIVVLGQYLISLQYEENRESALSKAWKKALDNRIFSLLAAKEAKGATQREKIAYIVEQDELARNLNDQYDLSESKSILLSGISGSVIQYINTIKKEIDAREIDRKHG